jgi:hypothetical protein
MNDLINSFFEFFSGILVLLNVWQTYKDKGTKGISIIPILFFTMWGYWNLYFYPSVKCWLSFMGGLVIVGVNSIWIGQILYYRREHKNE